jgi:hypothetical protein
VLPHELLHHVGLVLLLRSGLPHRLLPLVVPTTGVGTERRRGMRDECNGKRRCARLASEARSLTTLERFACILPQEISGETGTIAHCSTHQHTTPPQHSHHLLHSGPHLGLCTHPAFCFKRKE